MSNIFDFNARADEALVGGASADTALGIPQPGLSMGRYAPGNAQAPEPVSPELAQMRARTAAMRQPAQPAAPEQAPDPMLGYNPTTKRVFSAGQEFELDVGPGMKALQAGLLDQDNADLPDGFIGIRSSQVKGKLKSMYDSLGGVDAAQRRMGQMAAGFGSTVRDLTGDLAGQGLEQYGRSVAENNPSHISSVGDIPGMPGQFAQEGIGQIAPDVGMAVAGSAVGASLGAALAPATLGISVPLGAVLGGLAGRFIPSLFETYGSVRSEQRELGTNNKGAAFGAAAGSAALESLLGPEAKLATQAGRAAARQGAGVSVTEARNLLGTGAARRYGTEAGKQAIVEGGTEVPQSALERAGAGKSLTDDQAQTEYGLGAAFGAFGGGAASPVGAMVEYGQAKRFIDNLNALQAVAADPSLPSAQRAQAARTVQDIYRGQSQNPALQAEIDTFRSALAATDAAIYANAERDALASGQPVDLLGGRAFPAESTNTGVTPLDRDRADEQDARLAERAAQPPAAPELSSVLAAGQAGQQWQDMQAQRNQGLMAAEEPGRAVPALLAQRGAQIRSSGDAAFTAGAAAQPIVQRLNTEDSALRAAQAAGAQFDDVMSGNLETALDDPATYGQYLNTQNAAMGAEPGVASRISPAEAPRSALPPADLQPISSPLVYRPAPALQDATDRPAPVLIQETRRSPGVPPPALSSSPASAGAGASRSKPVTEQGAAEDELFAAIEKELESTVSATKGRAGGKVTLPQGVLSGIARVLAGNRNDSPAVLEAGGMTIDSEKQAEYSTRMRAILDAARTVVNRMDALANAQSNVVPTSSKSIIKNNKNMTADEVAGFDAQTKAADLQRLQGAVRSAVDTLREAAGTDRNVEAVVAMLKKRIHGKTKQRVTNKERADKAKARGETLSATEFKGETSIDTLLSSAWSMYKDGSLSAEGLDRVRGGETRTSREEQAQGADQPLQVAAEKGYTRRIQRRALKRRKDETAASFKTRQQDYAKAMADSAEKGFMGVLAYFQRHGTGYERLLASSIGRAIRREVNKKRADNAPEPTLVFMDDGDTSNPRYDPKTNTIYIHKTASPEEALHEGLHAALQWYVYGNAESAEVTALKKSLARVLEYKGDMPAKAREVVDVLRRVAKGKTKTAELDAVLELVSYGSTLGDFREFLKTMESERDPGDWYAGITDLWKRVAALVQRFLGVSNTVANDVLDATVALLEQAEADPVGPPGKRKGAVLQQEVGNVLESAVSTYPTTASTVDNLNEHNYAQYANRTLPEWVSTKVLFDAIRWDKAAAAIGKVIGKAGDWVQQYPTMTRWVSLLNSRFGLSPDLAKGFDDYKNAKQAGYKYAERIARIIEADPKLGREVLEYLDGDDTKLQDNDKLRDEAGRLRFWRDKYVQDLPAGQREFFSNLKFSEGMVFASATSQVASRSFGARNLRELAAVDTKYEPELLSQWFEKDTSGDVITDGRFFEVTNKAGRHEGFISEWTARQMAGSAVFDAQYTIDGTKVWLHAGKTPKGHKFTAAKTLGDAMNNPGAVANALRNTMAILAGTYASVEFSNNIAKFGYDDKGNATAQAVVFDDPEAVKAVFGYAPPENSILAASTDEAKSRFVLNLYRSSHQWVRVPKSKAYGPLAGKLMTGSAWNAMQDMSNRQPLIGFEIVNDSMRYFKKAKTIYNPGTHVTNVLTNFTLSMLHDIPPATVAKAAKLFALYELDAKRLSAEERRVMLAFMDSNAMMGDFSSVEVKQAIYNAMRDNMAANVPANGSKVGAYLGQFSAYEKAKAKLIKGSGVGGKLAERADNMFTEIYSAEDNIFRLAAFLTKAGEAATASGKAPTDAELSMAGNFAKSAFLDYDIDSFAVRALRQTVLPFVSWTYAIMPVLGHIALHKPWKILNLLVGYYMVEQALQLASGDSDEEDEEKRKVGPEFIRDRILGFGPYMHVRVPFMGDEENPTYYRLGAYVPLSNYADTIPNSFMGLSGWPAPVTPGGPFISGVLAMMGGVDPYTGRQLSSPTASSLEQFAVRSQFMVSQFVPNLPIPVLNEREAKKLEDIVAGKQGVTGVDASNLQLARWMGLKAYDYNLGEASAQQQLAMKAIKREFDTEIAKLKRAEMRYETPDWEGFMEKRDALLERMNERMAEAKGEE